MRIPIWRVLAACFIFLAPLASVACSSVGSIPTISQTLDEKALYVAELSYAGGLASVETALDAGVLTGADAAEAGAILDQVNTALVLARQAYHAGESLQAVSAIQSAYSLLAELRTITPIATLPH